MSTNKNPELPPKSEELLEAKENMKTYSEGLSEGKQSFSIIKLDLDPNIVHEIVRDSSLGDLLLTDGESLSDSDDQDKSMVVGKMAIARADLCVRTSQHNSYQSRDWLRELGLRFYYPDSRDYLTAYQELSVGITEISEHVSRFVFASEHNEIGYYGHNREGRQAEVADLIAITGIFKQLLR